MNIKKEIKLLMENVLDYPYVDDESLNIDYNRLIGLLEKFKISKQSNVKEKDVE